MTGSGRSRRGGGPGARCDEVRILLMGYLDGELDEDAHRRVQDHLAVCVSCRREERSYRRLGEVTEMAAGELDLHVDAGDAWAGIYSRLERGLGWILMSLGLVILGGFGIWHFLNDFLLSSGEPLLLRVGVAAVAAGGLLLLVSFLREKLWRDSRERYREVQR